MEAEEAYRTSLELNPELDAAKHNLHLLLGASKDSKPYTHIPLNLSCVQQRCQCGAEK